MKLLVLFAAALVAAQVWMAVPAAPAADKSPSGESLFKTHCAVCHPGGGNIVNPAKTLHKKDREKNGIAKPDEVIGRMRNPGPGMTKFDEKTISDAEARQVAEYILKTFN